MTEYVTKKGRDYLSQRGDIRVCRTEGCDKEGMWTNDRTCKACGEPTSPSAARPGDEPNDETPA